MILQLKETNLSQKIVTVTTPTLEVSSVEITTNTIYIRKTSAQFSDVITYNTTVNINQEAQQSITIRP
jgi:hypothetical protein